MHVTGDIDDAEVTLNGNGCAPSENVKNGGIPENGQNGETNTAEGGDSGGGRRKSRVLEKKFPETGAFCFPDFSWIWQDFLPSKLVAVFSAEVIALPSLLLYVPEVSEVLKDGAYWFNFVFEWWFSSTVIKDKEEEEPKLAWPCAKCHKRFAKEWEVSLHFITDHAPQNPSTDTSAPPPPPQPVIPEVVEEEEEWPETFEELHYIKNWSWLDFLPDWNVDFLPTPYIWVSDTLDIDGMEELKPKPVRLPSPKPVSKPAFQPRLMAPILKQTKYICLTCDLTICNSCFSKKCCSHNVTWMGQAKFACGACPAAE